MKQAALALSILISTLMVGSSFADIDSELKEAIDTCFKENEPKLAYELMLTELNTSLNAELAGGTYNAELADYMFTTLSNRFVRLQGHTTLSSRSRFAFEDLSAIQVRILLEKSELKSLLPSFDQPEGVISPKDLKTLINLALATSFSIPDSKDIGEILNGYDDLKEPLEKWVHMEVTCISRRKNLVRHIRMKQRLDSLKTSIIEERTKYLSYTVVSPILADTARRVFDADLGSGRTRLDWPVESLALIGPDKIKTKSAVEFLAKQVKKGWIRECSEDVRRQFFGVLKRIKDISGEAEYRNYESLFSLIKPDSDASVGGKAWWP